MHNHIGHSWLLSFLLLMLLVATSVFANHGALRINPFNPNPVNTSGQPSGSFATRLREYLDHEIAQNDGEHHPAYVVSGGTHGAAGGLTSAAFATVAHVPERINQTATAITYNTAIDNTCWVIISADTNGITDWTQVGSTAYYYFCEGDTTPTEPTLPANSAFLLQVDIRGCPGSCAIQTVNEIGVRFITGTETIGVNRRVGTQGLWVVHPRGQISLGGGATLTFLGALIASPTQAIFSGTGTVSFTGNLHTPVLYTRWWGIVGDGTTDDTTNLRAACVALNSRAGGTLDFQDHTYRLYNGVTGTWPTVCNFSGVNGVHLRASGARFHVTADFPVSGDRGNIFEFTNSDNITIGDMVGTYTGTRCDIYNCGNRLLYFVGRNSNIQIGNVDVSDYSVGIHFHNNTGNALSTGTKNIVIANLKTLRTGYGIITHRSGHAMQARIDSESTGRTCFLQDMQGPSKLFVRSLNFQASSDCVLQSTMEDLDLHYVNTDSGTAVGRPVHLTYPIVDSDGARLVSNVKIHVDIRGTGFTLGLVIGMGVGVAGASADPAYRINNLEVSGVIQGNDATQQLVSLQFPSAWTTATNIGTIKFHNLRLLGGGAQSFDLRGLVTLATFEHVFTNSNLSMRGNTTGKIVLRNVIAPEVFADAAVDAEDSFIHFNHSNIYDATNLTTTPAMVRRTFVQSYIDDVIQNSPIFRHQPFQTFVLTITNTAGTLQHQIVGDIFGQGPPVLAQRITGASATLATTPSLSASVDFVSGVGIQDFSIVLNTAAQTGANMAFMAVVEFYSGGVTHPSVVTTFGNINVAGVARNRVHLRLYSITTGAEWTINTTNIPAGRSLSIRLWGYVL